MKNIFIQKDPKKGRGVYAQTDIPDGSLIETCHLLIIPLKSVPYELEGYVYEYEKSMAALALGSGSLYNHSDQSNATFRFDRRKKLLYIEAITRISSGQEITIHYGYTESDRKKFGIF